MSIKNIATEVIRKEASALDVLSQNMPNDFEDIVNLMNICSGRVILSGIGKSGIIAKKISASLSSTGTKSFFIHASEASHGDLGMIDPSDILLILSNSGNTHELNDIINFAHTNGIAIIAMTKNPDSNLGKSSQYILTLPDIPEATDINAPTTSTLLMLALGDAITVSLIELKNFKKEDFKRNHPGGNLGKIL